MTEHDAQQVLLVRAIERQPASSTWTDEDRLHASQEALRQTGPEAERSTFVIERARLACERLIARKPALGDLLHSLQWRGWFTPVALLVALLAGALLDSAGGNRINILNPPLLLIIVWNLFTYLVLAISAISAKMGRGRTGDTSASAGKPGKSARHAASQDQEPAGTGGWLRRHVVRLATGQGWKRTGRSREGSVANTFRASWFHAAAPLYSQRALTLLHGGALMFALGALISLYLHGLVLEYRAGWQSTFLNPQQVETLTHLFWGPASLISGIALPDANGLAAIRFPHNPGENAAQWIHLQTLTVLLIVVIPRLLLALWAREQSRKLSTHFPLSLDESYFRDLLRSQRGDAAVAWALPYSYHLSDAAQAGLSRLLQQALGGSVSLRLQPPLPLGGEDDLQSPLPGLDGASLAAAVYSLSATPEAENHAAFLATLARHVPAGLPLVALVDESGFRARFGADSDRLESRRNAWRRILASRSDIQPLFVDLAAEPARDVLDGLDALLAASTRTMPASA